MFNLFTIEKANEILPEVKRRFNEIIICKNTVMDIQEELQNLTDSSTSMEKFIKKKQELNMSVTNLYRLIQNLEAMGILVKSVEDGLLDFPSIRHHEEIWLCWKLGEEKVTFWHGKEDGFMGRKPIPQKGFQIIDDFADLR